MKEMTVFDQYGNSLNDVVQYDVDVMVYVKRDEITKEYPVHFFNRKCTSAYVVESKYSEGTLKAKIPNRLLREEYPVVGYVYVTDDAGESKSLYGFKLSVTPRPKPSDVVFVDTKDYIDVTEVLAECREYAQNLEESVSAAEASAQASEASRQAADQSATDAEAAKTAAETAAGNAADSEQSASESAQSAADSAAEAKAAETASEQNAAAAESAQTAAAESEKNAKVYSDNADAKAEQADDAAKRAAASAAEAAASETASGQNAAAAEESKNAAAASEQNAKTSETAAEKWSKLSESYAHGGTGTRDGEGVDNSQAYCERAEKAAKQAESIVGGDFVPNSDRGIPGGVATLDDTGKVPENQIPDSVGSVKGVKGEKEDKYRTGEVNITKENIGLGTSEELIGVLGYTPVNKDGGDTADTVTTFESADTVTETELTAWTDVPKLESGEKHSSIFGKVSTMFRNARYLFKLMGKTDISKIGDATVTGALAALMRDKLNVSDVVDNLLSTAADKPLSGNMGKELKTQLDELNTRTSKLTSFVIYKETIQPNNKLDINIYIEENTLPNCCIIGVTNTTLADTGVYISSGYTPNRHKISALIDTSNIKVETTEGNWFSITNNSGFACFVKILAF